MKLSHNKKIKNDPVWGHHVRARQNRKSLSKICLLQAVQAHRQGSGQATLEFSFSIIVVVLLLMGMIQVFMWTGTNLAEQRRDHEQALTTDVHGLQQTRAVFYSPEFTEIAVPTNIFGGETFN